MLGGTFITKYTDKKKRINDNVWCCMSSSLDGDNKSVWKNARLSAMVCDREDPRTKRTNSPPVYTEITVLTVPSRWRRISAKQAKRQRRRALAIQVTSNISSQQAANTKVGRWALYLPSVWDENANWTAEQLITELRRKAGDYDLTGNNWILWEIDVYIIHPNNEPSENIGYFTPVEVRPPSFIGSWYPNDIAQFRIQQSSSLSSMAAIVPHAGFRYSHKVGSSIFSCFSPKHGDITFVILGPSHYTYSSKLMFPEKDAWATIGGIQLPVDRKMAKDIMTSMPSSLYTVGAEDGREHSLEMMLPWIAANYPSASILPILVGSGVDWYLAAKAFTPSLGRKNTLFLISSDFCHWGNAYDYHPKNFTPDILTSMKNLDMQGLESIKMGSKAFEKYLKETGNTVCGQTAILLLLSVIEQQQRPINVGCVNYDTSSHNAASSSIVSYLGMTFTTSSGQGRQSLT